MASRFTGRVGGLLWGWCQLARPCRARAVGSVKRQHGQAPGCFYGVCLFVPELLGWSACRRLDPHPRHRVPELSWGMPLCSVCNLCLQGSMSYAVPAIGVVLLLSAHAQCLIRIHECCYMHPAAGCGGGGRLHAGMMLNCPAGNRDEGVNVQVWNDGGLGTWVNAHQSG
jgi:hypothetical protein